MRRIAVLVTVLAIATLGLAIPAGAGESCHNINAWGEGEATGPFSTVAQIQGGGLLQGTTEAEFSPVGLDGSVLSFTGYIEFTTNRATLKVTLAGTLDLDNGFFEADGPVTEATGKLAGAEGHLYFEGDQDLVTGAFTETVTGEICVDLGGNGKK